MAAFLAGIFGGAVGSYGLLTNWTFNLETTKAKPKPNVDFNKIREQIEELLPNPQWDDGSLGPVLVRLAWHASGTYDAQTKTGGSNGATMRFPPEMKDGANAGLNKAQKFLEPIKQQNPGVSYADLWILASYQAIEFMGGPSIPFTPGRKDALSEQECPPNGRLPDATKDAKHVRDVFYRMGFSDREIVALIGGGHTIGRCHKDRSGFEGPWTNTPLTVSNAYFKVLLDQDWKPKKWDGPKQFEDKSGKLMMLPTDMEIKTDKDFRKWAEIYKNDNNQLLQDFGDAFKKLTELGFVQKI